MMDLEELNSLIENLRGFYKKHYPVRFALYSIKRLRWIRSLNPILSFAIIFATAIAYCASVFYCVLYLANIIVSLFVNIGDDIFKRDYITIALPILMLMLSFEFLVSGKINLSKVRFKELKNSNFYHYFTENKEVRDILAFNLRLSNNEIFKNVKSENDINTISNENLLLDVELLYLRLLELKDEMDAKMKSKIKKEQKAKEIEQQLKLNKIIQHQIEMVIK